MKTTYQRLIDNFEYLKLKEIGSNLDRVIEEFNINNLSFVDTLLKLTDKGIDDFDFDYQDNLNKQDILDLLSHRFIHNFENIIFIGPSGVGKTHLATSIGISTYFIKFNDLINQLKKGGLMKG